MITPKIKNVGTNDLLIACYLKNHGFYPVNTLVKIKAGRAKYNSFLTILLGRSADEKNRDVPSERYPIDNCCFNVVLCCALLELVALLSDRLGWIGGKILWSRHDTSTQSTSEQVCLRQVGESGEEGRGIKKRSGHLKKGNFKGGIREKLRHPLLGL
jgi:hypothetical protein